MKKPNHQIHSILDDARIVIAIRILYNTRAKITCGTGQILHIDIEN